MKLKHLGVVDVDTKMFDVVGDHPTVNEDHPFFESMYAPLEEGLDMAVHGEVTRYART